MQWTEDNFYNATFCLIISIMLEHLKDKLFWNKMTKKY